MRTLWINARFIDRPITGVERVAHELLGALSRHVLDPNGCFRDENDGQEWQVRLLAPRVGLKPSPWKNIALERRGAGTGHLWEQFSLPLLTRGEWLFSPCNTGPAFKRHHMVYLHDAQPFAIARNFSFRFGTWYRLLFRLAARHAAGFVVNSQFTRNELSQYLSIPLDRMTLCSPGSEHVHDRSPPRAADLEAESIPPGYLLAVSSVTPNKNFAAVIQALQILGADAPPCVIVGMRNSRVFGEVDFPKDRVTALGFVSDAALHTLYRNALALIFPSFYEGFGLPPLEAMALGCPVIVSNTAALPEVAGDAAIYCDPNDPATIVSAVRRLLSEPALFSQLSEAGKRRAANFSWHSSALKLVDSLKRLNTTHGAASRRLESSSCA